MRLYFTMLGWVLMTLTSALNASESCTHSKDHFACVKYLENYDGDTVRFKIPSVHPLLGESIAIRLAGVDTPEMRGKSSCEKVKARQARDFVQSRLSKAKKIELRQVKRGKYFRIVADIYYDGQSLAQELLKEGLGVPYGGGKKAKKDWCQNLSAAK